MSNLAIVIPAFKITYFEQALSSIADQTCKDFTLYIGNDASPDDFRPIIAKYSFEFPIIYKCFDKNLGSKSLVDHWERCLDLVGEEEWIWLFSDDDVMDPTCVESFYLTLNQCPEYDLFHFNVKKVDEFNNETVTQFMNFPDVLTCEEFLLNKLKGGYVSTVVEYIFRRSHFIEQDRFQNFDLAWCTDDATWIKLSMKKGIKTIANSKVYWRVSMLNISSINNKTEIVIRKLCAQIEFANWANKKLKQGEIRLDIPKLQELLGKWVVTSIQLRSDILPYRTIIVLIRKLNLVLGKEHFPIVLTILLFFHKIYSLLRNYIKRKVFR